jgi:hypothetical protein
MKILDIAYLKPSAFNKRQLELTVRSPYSLTVPSHVNAIDAVRIAELNHIDVICVVEPARKLRVQGIVSLDWVSKQIRDHKGIKQPSLIGQLSRMVEDPAEVERSFHHEWLSGDSGERPDLGWCLKHGHLTVLPCTL